MTIKQQVCSLELAKKLNELGVKQESRYYWLVKEPYTRFIAFGSTGGTYHYADSGRMLSHDHPYEVFSAFTVAELGEILPLQLSALDIVKTGEEEGKWQWEFKPRGRFGHTETEADARAEILIYLLENNLMNL